METLKTPDPTIKNPSTGHRLKISEYVTSITFPNDMVNPNIQRIQRSESVVTGKKNVEDLYVFPNFPVYIGCTNDPEEMDIRADMKFGICKDSGVIQLMELLPLDVIYSKYHSEAVGGVWKEHHLAFVDFVTVFAPNHVLEIGGGSGFIAKTYAEKNPSASWTIVEPTPKISDEGNIRVIAGMFNSNFNIDSPVDAVVHSHVFEHMYDPREFMAHVSSFLNVGDMHVFSVPNLKKYLANKFSNCMNFEHTFFLTEDMVEYFLGAFGFEVLEKKYFGEHSIFYATKKVSNPVLDFPLPDHYHEYRELFMDFIKYYESFVADLNEKIEQFPGKVYLFGAHVFSQFLIQMGLKTTKVIGVLDNSEIKRGQRLYGTNLFVDLPLAISKSKDPVAIVLRAGGYQEEIRKQLLEMNPEIRIFE